LKKKIRRPSFNGPSPPKPIGDPFDPPEGSDYDNGTWRDANGNVLGYALNEESPLVPGSENWWQDQNPQRSYYDLQNFNSGSTSGSLNNYTQNRIRDAVAARQMRDYNSGQRGMPQPSIYSPSVLAQREANMGRNMAISSLDNNFDWWHNRPTPTRQSMPVVINNYSKPVLRKNAISMLKKFGG